jgi:UPF0716 protein FxsA
MALLLVLLFLVAPLVELAVIVQVASTIGVLDTIGLLILMSLVGAWLARREGLGVLRRIQDALDHGRMPSTEVADGALVLLAGALMIAPGFVSDTLAILLLLPPTRALVRRPLLRAASRRGRVTMMSSGGMSSGGMSGGGMSGGGTSGDGVSGRRGAREDVWDVESWEEPPTPSTRGELGGPQ